MGRKMNRVRLDRIASSIDASLGAGTNSVILWVDDAAYLLSQCLERLPLSERPQLTEKPVRPEPARDTPAPPK